MTEVDLRLSFSNCQIPAWNLSGTGEEVGIWSLETKRKVSRSTIMMLNLDMKKKEKKNHWD